MRMRKFVQLLTAMFLIAGLLAAPTSAEARQTIRLTIGGGHPAGTIGYITGAHEQFQVDVSRMVEERTNYDILWIEAYGGTIASLSEMVEATQHGLLDIGVINPLFVSSDLFLHGIAFFVPMTTGDTVILGEVMDVMYEEFPYFKDILQNNFNQKFLGIGFNGGFQLFSSRPVHSMEDLRGLRVAGAGANLHWLRNTGAVPVQDTIANGYTSIQTGVYDAWLMLADSIMRFRIYEVAPYDILVDFGSAPNGLLTINMNTWNRLPAEIQDILVEAGRLYSLDQRTRANEDDVFARNYMQTRGLTTIEFPLEEREKWIALLPNIPDIWVEEVENRGFPGRVMMDRFLELFAERGVTLPRDTWGSM